MSIEYFAEQIKQPPEYYIDISTVNNWIQKCVKSKRYKNNIICIIFTTDKNLLDINKQFLQKDYLTDIITFSYSENNELSGDIFISIDRVKENAQKYDVSFRDEILRVIIHGILHLMGYEDYNDQDKQVMRNEENLLLKLYPKQ